MAKRHLVPGAVLLGIAFFLSLLASVSLPNVKFYDVVRATFGSAGFTPNNQLSEARWGIWGFCFTISPSPDFICQRTGFGYRTQFADARGGVVTISAGLTKGQVVHPVATAVLGVAFFLSLSTNVTIVLAASLVTFLGALFSLISLILDVVLFEGIKRKMKDLQITPGVSPRVLFGTILLPKLSGSTSGSDSWVHRLFLP
jgi:hypothetical protein